MKIQKPLSKMSIAYLRTLKQDLILEIEAGSPKEYKFFISDKQLGPQEYGETDTANKELTFASSQTLKDLINTLIHEYLHVVLPHAKHPYIYKLTTALMRELTNSDKERLFQALAIRSVWDE